MSDEGKSTHATREEEALKAGRYYRRRTGRWQLVCSTQRMDNLEEKAGSLGFRD
jgi:hypothetical protein